MQQHIEAIAEHLLRVFPLLDEAGQRLALALYDELAQAVPVLPSTIADRLEIPADKVVRQLHSWPGVYYDGDHRVIGFWGLTIAPMPHRLLVNGCRLYAWCAWDTLFLPALLGADVEVESACRATGNPVRLTATPQAVRSVEPAELVVSFLLPDAEAVTENVITSFCHYVHFFRSQEVARPWVAEHPKTFVLSLADAYEVGRRINQARYGYVLDVTPLLTAPPARR